MSEAESAPVATVLDARRLALAAMARVPVEATGLVNYSSAGRLLIVADREDAVTLAGQIPAALQPTMVLLDRPRGGTADPRLPVLHGERMQFRLEGHLGGFRVRLEPGTPEAQFDLVVDLCREPLFSDAWPRFGYHRLDRGADLDDQLRALAEQTGQFEKPKFFHYSADLCVRGRSGFTACNRCVQACPAGAISGLAERIEVDPFLCQGGGICATVCPGGALQYAYPRVEDSVARLRRLLMAYRDAGGAEPRLLIHQAEAPPDLETMPGQLLPFATEEIASLGMEFWLCALAFGARAVRLQRPQRGFEPMLTALEVQLADANGLVSGLGFPWGVIDWEDRGEALMPAIAPAVFAAAGGKRELLFLALDHLVAAAAPEAPEIELAGSATLGEILVDPGKCTLCVSCASVCPRGAVTAEEERPALRFFEAHCVQCGLCQQACPEHAIQLRPRLLLDAQARARGRILHQEQPFECIRCGKPFATRSSIDKVMARLQDHPMFADEAARRRLQMCGDCRVADMMDSTGTN